MKKQMSFLLLLFLSMIFKTSAQEFQITQVKLEFNGNQLHITYNIDNKDSPGKFNITIQIIGPNGEAITPKSITGDIGDNIKPGINKKIIWDLEKDTINIDEDISVELKGEKLVKSFSKSSLILMSTAVPGLGQTKMSSKPWWLGSIAAYGILAGGLIIHKSSRDTYDSYIAEDNPDARTAEYDKAQKKLTLANTLFVTSAALWVANIIWVAFTPGTNQPLKNAKVYLKPVTFPNSTGAMVSLRVDF